MQRLITLGGLRVDSGTHAGQGSARTRLVCLAVVAASGERGIRREKLSSMLWPDSDEERARSALRQALFVIRRDMGGAEVTTGTADLRLNPAVIDSDVDAFRRAVAQGRLDEAVALYGGPFLDGVYVNGAAELERWIEDERTALAGSFQRAIEQLAAAAGRAGMHTDAARWWARAAAHDRFSARVSRAFMEALVAAGDREAALRHATAHADIVRSELEADPDAGLMAYARSLRTVPGNRDAMREAPAPPVTARRDAEQGAATSNPAGAPPPAPLSSEPVAPTHATPVREGAMPPVRRWAAWAGASIIILAVALGIRSVAGRSASGEQDIRTVVVMPIANLTNDSTFEAVASLATTRMREHLRGSVGVTVIDAARLTGEPSESLLRSEMRRAGDSLLVSFELVNSRDGRVLLSFGPVAASADAPQSLMTALPQTVSGAVAALTDSVYLPWRTAASRPPTFEALQAFHQGLAALAGDTPETAISHLRRAMQLDPEFVEAKILFLETAELVGLARVVLDSVRMLAVAQRDRLGAYDQLALDRQLAFLDGRLEDAYQASRRLVAIAPRTPDAYLYFMNSAMATNRYRESIEAFHAAESLGGYMRNMTNMRSWDLSAHRLRGEPEIAVREWRAFRGRFPLSEGTQCIDGIRVLATAGKVAAVDSLIDECRSVRVSPRPADVGYEVAGRQLRAGGHAAASRRAFARALAMRIDAARSSAARSGTPYITPPNVANLHCEMGNWQAAFDILRAASLPPHSPLRVTLAVAAAHVGAARQSTRILEQLVGSDSSSTRSGEVSMQRAFIQLALGRREDALRSLRAARDGGISPAWNGWYMRWELDALRGDPRFEAMLRPRE